MNRWITVIANSTATTIAGIVCRFNGLLLFSPAGRRAVRNAPLLSRCISRRERYTVAPKELSTQHISRNSRAGVSAGTVSAVLSGKHPHVRVSEETRKLILETARRTNYRPNAIARALRRRSTNILGLYSGWDPITAHHPVYAQIIAGLQDS